MLLGIIGWVVVGLVVGFIATKVVNIRGDDPTFGFAAAAAGAIVAGIIHAVASGTGVTPWNMWSLIWAAVGACVGVAAYHLIRSRSISHEPYTRRSSY